MPLALVSCAVVSPESLKSSTRILSTHWVGAAVTPAWENATCSGVTAIAGNSLSDGATAKGTANSKAIPNLTETRSAAALNKLCFFILR
jgi:hypothetical protein